MTRHKAVRILAATATVALVGLPAPAMAADGGCRAFGEHVSSDAHTLQPSGHVVSQFAPINGHIRDDFAALC